MLAVINNILAPLENLIKNNRKYIGYFLIFISFYSLSLIVFPDSIKGTWEQARNVLFIILFLPILSRVFWLQIATSIMPLRKELGILMGSLAFVHGWGYIIQYPSFIADTSFWWQDGQVMYFWVWFIALMMTMPLLLTSNRWAIRKLWKNWKRLHRLAYGIVIFVILHIVLISWYKNPQTVWYTNTDILIQFSILIGYFLGKILEWKGIRLFKVHEIKYPIGQQWFCVPCGYIYDPVYWDEDSGILPGVEFSDIPDNWRCPVCGVTKADFVPYEAWMNQVPLYTASVTHKTFLNPTTIELIIETNDDLQSQVWQFVSFVWGDEEWEFTRQYSIVRQEGRRFTFLIKLTDTGRGSYILRNIVSGADVRIKWVFGTFRLQDTNNPKIFIATGTGLAPIYNMICSLPLDKRGTLYFCTASATDLFYIDELRLIEWLDLHIHTTREEIPGCIFGRVDIDLIPATPETEWYFCGNPRMVMEAVGKLTAKGYTRIYKEEF